MRLRRALTVAVLCAIAAGGLSGCQSKVGQAAAVNGQQLSDSDLGSYVQAGAVPYTPSGATAQIVPKVYALQNWIDDRVFAKTVEKHGGAASTAELRLARTAVLSGHKVSDAEAYYKKFGYTTKFADLLLAQEERLLVLIQRLAPGTSAAQAVTLLSNGQAGSVLLKTILAAKPKVVVSSRYGVWDPSRVALTSTGSAGAPGFIRFRSAASTP